jgi:beta-glucosidase
MPNPPFPADFLWGTTSSSTGTEGAAPRADWAAWEDERRVPRSGDGNGWATNFADDVVLLRSLAANAIRVTVEWARVEPRSGEVDTAVVEQYRSMLEAARSKELAPWITLQHGSLPGWFSDDAHGFRDERARGYFWPRHVDRCAEWFEDLAAGWVAIEDPTGWAVQSHLIGARPPGRRDRLQGRDALLGAIDANHAAWKLLRGGAAPTMCVIGVRSPHMRIGSDETDPDVAAWAYVTALQTGLLTLPSIGSFELPHLRDSYDHLGIAHHVVGRGEPALLTECVSRVADVRDTRRIVIAANGVATDDEDARDEYLRGVIDQLRLLRADGVDLAGYFHHTGIDGYEWSDGFARPRGLITRDRAVKAAGRSFQQIAGARHERS